MPAAPGEAGRAVKLLSVIPGVGRIRDQIGSLAAEWEDHNSLELASLSPSDEVMVVLGDSLSQGVGASSLANTWPMLLRRRLGDAGLQLRLVNLAASGARIDDVVDGQLPRMAALGLDPVVTTCTIGSNDLMWSVRIGPSVGRLRRLVGRLPRSAVLATLPDRGSLVARAFNRHLRAEASAASLDIAEVAKTVKLNRRAFASDGFHPNDAGYQGWLEAFTAELVR